MAIFTACFGADVSAKQDVFEITAPATSAVVLRSCRLGQWSDFTDAQAEILWVSIIRGYTTAGEGGQAITPANLSGVSGAKAAVSTVTRNNTTVAKDGTGVVLFNDTFNVAAGWWYTPVIRQPYLVQPSEQIVIAPSQRLVIRIEGKGAAGAPADTLSMVGTLVFEEIGKMVVN